MSESEAAMADCIFCRIVAGEIGSRQVYADAAAVAFLDIAGWHPGHALVVPRRHVPDVLSDPTALAEISPAIVAVGNLLRDRLGASGVNLLSNCGESAGQEVFHLHVHVVPRYDDEPGLDRMAVRGRKYDLDAIHARLVAAE